MMPLLDVVPSKIGSDAPVFPIPLIPLLLTAAIVIFVYYLRATKTERP